MTNPGSVSSSDWKGDEGGLEHWFSDPLLSKTNAQGRSCYTSHMCLPSWQLLVSALCYQEVLFYCSRRYFSSGYILLTQTECSSILTFESGGLPSRWQRPLCTLPQLRFAWSDWKLLLGTESQSLSSRGPRPDNPPTSFQARRLWFWRVCLPFLAHFHGAW